MCLHYILHPHTPIHHTHTPIYTQSHLEALLEVMAAITTFVAHGEHVVSSCAVSVEVVRIACEMFEDTFNGI